MANRITAEVSIILHATEDPEKFFSAFARYCLTREDFDVSHYRGHFGNRITVLGARIVDTVATKFIVSLVRRMRTEQIASVLDGIDDCARSSALYMRFDRQKFVSGGLELSQEGPVHIKLFKPLYRAGDARGAYAELLGSLRDVALPEHGLANVQ